MTRAFETIETPRSAAGFRDTRAEGGERDVMLTADRVTIGRRYAGIRMKIGVPTRAYRGVVLSLEETAAGTVCYRVTLRHADPDLSVILTEAFDEGDVVEDLRDWARFLRQTPLLEREPGALAPLHDAYADRPGASVLPRRRGRSAPSRSRGRFARHRRPARLAADAPVYLGEREIVSYE